MSLTRRKLLQTASLGVAASICRPASTLDIGGIKKAPHVIIIGGGFAGTAAARQLRLGSKTNIQITLIEPHAQFIACPKSNHVIAGLAPISEITRSYEQLIQKHNIRLIAQPVTNIDPEKKLIQLGSNDRLTYDRLIVSPGIDFVWQSLPAANNLQVQNKIIHAWKAGPQITALREQLQAMPNGGVFAITIPLQPYRCPPAPYERACLIAEYFSRYKPRSKILIFDENEDITSKAALFKRAWAERYSQMIEYRPNHQVTDVDMDSKTLKFEFDDDLKADVLNIIPKMRAGDIAFKTGLATANQRWCEVDFLSFESKAIESIHVIGDAIQTAPLMPKSAQMAVNHGQTCANAVAALIDGQPIELQPKYLNNCYSYISENNAMHLSTVHRFDPIKKTMVNSPSEVEISSQYSELETAGANQWERNIWANTLN